MYLALYRKYRPKFFRDVVGQKYIVDALKNQVKSNKIGHAFLFTGTRGTGKTTCAKIFSKAVNCLNPEDGEPCGECDICKGLEKESIFDVVEMDAASNNGVNDIRKILDEVNFLPISARYRVYIIDEVHMLSNAAFNALLKTLEEPPAHVIFILATTEIHKVPRTILSRCQRFDFNKLSNEEISDKLISIAENENVSLTRPAASLIASLSDGALRDAISIFETCLSVTPDVDENVVSEVVGITKDEDLFALADALIEKDFEKALMLLKKVSLDNVDEKKTCESLIEHFSNLLLVSSKGSSAELLNISKDYFERLSDQSKNTKARFITSALDKLIDCLSDINKGQNPKTSLKICVFSICNTAGGISADTAGTHENTVNKTSAALVKKEIHAEKTENTQAEIKQSSIKTAGETDSLIFKDWNKVIDLIQQNDTPLYMVLKDSSAYLYENRVYIRGNEMLNSYIRNNSQTREQIKNAIFRVTNCKYSIGGYKNLEEKLSQNISEDDTIEKILKLKDKGINVIVEE